MLSVWVRQLFGSVRRRLWTAWLLVSAGLFMCLGAPCDCAQDQPVTALPATDLAGFSIENLLDIGVVTASKRSQTLRESPAAVFVVDSTDISRYGYRTLADALRSIVGLYTTSDRSFDYLGVRGYSRFGDYNGRVLLLVDGHRVNDPVFDTAPVGEDCPVDMDDVERIEVVKGPGSSLWGTNALLATVNVITRDGQHTRGGRLAADSEKLYAAYGNSYPGDLSVDFSVTGLWSVGEKNIYFPEYDSPDTNNGVAQNADEMRATRGHVSASYKGLKFAYSRGKRSKEVPTAAYDTVFNDPGTRIEDGRVHAELSYERPVDETSKHEFLARAFTDEYSYIGDYVYDYPPRTINRDNDFAKWWGGELRFSDTVSDDLFVTYGAEYTRVGHSTQSNYDVDPYLEYYCIPSTQTSRSLYAQASYKPSDLLQVTLGTRRDTYSSFGSTWSPRAALVYSLSKNTTLKGLYGSAFRAPNFYELAWQNADLPQTQPEKIQTKELVWERRLDTNSRLIASLFSFEVRDIISLIETEDSWYIANHGRARSRGFEVQYETRSSYGTRGYAGLCATRTTGGDGELSNSPDYLLTCGLSMPVLSHRYYLSPQIRTTGRLSTKLGQEIAPVAVVDLVIAAAGYGEGTNLSLGIYNIFDKTVCAPAPIELVQDKVPQPGRTLRLTAVRSF